MGTITCVHKVLSEKLFCKDSGELNWNLIFHFSSNSNEVEIHKVGAPDPFCPMRKHSVCSNPTSIKYSEWKVGNRTGHFEAHPPFWLNVVWFYLTEEFFHWRGYLTDPTACFLGEPTFLSSSFFSDLLHYRMVPQDTICLTAWQELDVNKTLGWSSNHMHFPPPTFSLIVQNTDSYPSILNICTTEFGNANYIWHIRWP